MDLAHSLWKTPVTTEYRDNAGATFCQHLEDVLKAAILSQANANSQKGSMLKASEHHSVKTKPSVSIGNWQVVNKDKTNSTSITIRHDGSGCIQNKD